MTQHKIGTREEWEAARAELLVREKELTRLSDELARQRRELPWAPVEKEYRFDDGRLGPRAHGPGARGSATDPHPECQSAGTDPVGYVTQGFGFSTFVAHDGGIYYAYSTTARGVEFLMGYYGILDRAPKGRDEGDSFQTWIRRHDEYEDASSRAIT